MDADMAKAVQGYVQLVQKQKEAAAGADKVSHEVREGSTRGGASVEGLIAKYSRLGAVIAAVTAAAGVVIAAQKESEALEQKALSGMKAYVLTGDTNRIEERRKEVEKLSRTTGRDKDEAGSALSKLSGLAPAAREEAVGRLQQASLLGKDKLDVVAEQMAIGAGVGLNPREVASLRTVAGPEGAAAIFQAIKQEGKKIPRGVSAEKKIPWLTRRRAITPEQAGQIKEAEMYDRATEMETAPGMEEFSRAHEIDIIKQRIEDLKSNEANLEFARSQTELEARAYERFGTGLQGRFAVKVGQTADRLSRALGTAPEFVSKTEFKPRANAPQIEVPGLR